MIEEAETKPLLQDRFYKFSEREKTMLIDKQTLSRAELLANLHEVAAEGLRVFSARVEWNAAHPGSRPLDPAPWWNRALHAERIIVKIFTAEPLTSVDADFLDGLVLDREPLDREPVE